MSEAPATGAALYFEDLVVGDTFLTSEMEISAEEIVDFASRWDPQPFHIDPEAAKDSYFKGLVASGWHTAAITMRLVVREGFIFADGMIGVTGDIAWPTPTRPGDRLSVAGVVLSTWRSDKWLDRGFAEVRWETSARDHTVKLRFTCTVMIFTRAGLSTRRPHS